MSDTRRFSLCLLASLVINSSGLLLAGWIWRPIVLPVLVSRPHLQLMILAFERDAEAASSSFAASCTPDTGAATKTIAETAEADTSEKAASARRPCPYFPACAADTPHRRRAFRRDRPRAAACRGSAAARCPCTDGDDQQAVFVSNCASHRGSAFSPSHARAIWGRLCAADSGSDPWADRTECV